MSERARGRRRTLALRAVLVWRQALLDAVRHPPRSPAISGRVSVSAPAPAVEEGASRRTHLNGLNEWTPRWWLRSWRLLAFLICLASAASMWPSSAACAFFSASSAWPSMRSHVSSACRRACEPAGPLADACSWSSSRPASSLTLREKEGRWERRRSVRERPQLPRHGEDGLGREPADLRKGERRGVSDRQWDKRTADEDDATHDLVVVRLLGEFVDVLRGEKRDIVSRVRGRAFLSARDARSGAAA